MKEKWVRKRERERKIIGEWKKIDFIKVKQIGNNKEKKIDKHFKMNGSKI